MKQVIIFHGSGGTPESFWFPYIKKELEQSGYDVLIPQLPDSDAPHLDKWLPVALQNNFTNETILIGHSSGCPLILSILERIDLKIKQVILVSGFSSSFSGDKERNPILQENYAWGKIKNRAEEFIFVNSDNDPWGCDDKKGKEMLEKLGGVLVVPHGEGHMGSGTFDQPYKEFPLLLKLISEIK